MLKKLSIEKDDSVTFHLQSNAVFYTFWFQAQYVSFLITDSLAMSLHALGESDIAIINKLSVNRVSS